MFRFSAVLIALCISFGASSAYAHDFWVNASDPKDQLVRVDIGYGHHFPEPEPIPEKRLHIFEAPRLVTPDGASELEQSGENYAYQLKKDLKKGSYLVLGKYRPTFWSKGPDGWDMKDRKQIPEATTCEKVTMFSKAVFNVDGSQDESFITKPAGTRLEIVPMANPAKIKPGDKFPVQVLFEGAPLRTAEITATFGGFSDTECKAFQGKTDLKGIINIIPLKAGYWFAKVKHNTEFEDKARCDKELLISTLTFHINN